MVDFSPIASISSVQSYSIRQKEKLQQEQERNMDPSKNGIEGTAVNNQQFKSTISPTIDPNETNAQLFQLVQAGPNSQGVAENGKQDNRLITKKVN